MADQREPPQRDEDPLDVLVAGVLERLTRGDAGALEELCAAHPASAEELRRRVGVLGELNLLPSDAAAMAFPERLGDFRLVRRLGGGGMGVVYEAVQISLGRTVALKLIRPEHLYFDRSRERFRREVEAVARLGHPGIVSIYTVGEEQGTPYFAMEMIQGATLAQVLEQVGGLAPDSLLGSDMRAAVLALAPESEATEPGDALFAGSWSEACARVIVRMTEALEHAHRRGVLHRDIKPSNIALTPGGRVVLLDFGLAGLEHDLRLTTSGSALGSVLYMAPEQVAGRIGEIDARTDVYALGVTLYELLSLQPPFGGADSQQTREAILEGAPAPIRSRNRALPRDLELVCLKALERERSRRYATMEAFGADLRNALEGRPVAARPPSGAYRARRWIQRHPTRSTALALGLLLLTVLPSALYLQQRASSRELARSLAAETLARSHADAERSEAEQVSRFLVELFGAADPYAAGRRDLTARELLDSGVQRVATELEGQPELQARLYERMGQSYTNLDLYTEALTPLDRALELRRALHGDEDTRTATAKLLVSSAARLAGRPDALALLREANRTFDRTPPAEPATLVNARALLAQCLLDQGGSDEPLALLEQARALLDALPEPARDQQWMVLTMLASAQEALGRHPQAEAAAREALALESETALTLNPWRGAALDTLARALRNQGRTQEACATFERLLPEARAFYDEDNVVLATMEMDYAAARQDLGAMDGVADTFERSFDRLRRRLGLRHPKTQRALTFALQALVREGRFEHCTERLDDLRRELTESAGADDPRQAVLSFWRGVLALAEGDRTAAVEALTRAVERVDPLDVEFLASSKVTLARALAEDPQRRAEARDLASDCMTAGSGEVRRVARYVLARAQIADGMAAEADVLLREGRAQRTPAMLPLWADAASDVLLAQLMLQRGELPSGCALLARALPELELRLGAHHADLERLRAELERSGATAACAGLARPADAPPTDR